MIDDVVGGKWRVVRPLSSGGMGDVYVAVHEATGREVALKVIKRSSDITDTVVARFEREARVLSRISHPNVVTFLDTGVTSKGEPFLVMELLSGKPLRDEMTRALPWKRALRIGADVARALAGTHATDVVHRDLKPENIFLQSSAGHDDFAKLIDFGIVRHQISTSPSAMTAGTLTGAVVGTPGYISPEQLAGDRATERSDLYALGVILFELVTGTFPFAAPTLQAMLVKQLVEETPLASSRATVPAHVDAVIRRLMDRDPARRPATALETVALLTQALDTIEALPPHAATETISVPGNVVPSVMPSETAPTAVVTVPVHAQPAKRAPPKWPFVLGAIALGSIALLALVSSLDSATFKRWERRTRDTEQTIRDVEDRVRAAERAFKRDGDNVQELIRATATYRQAVNSGKPINDADRRAYIQAYDLVASSSAVSGEVIVGSDPPGAAVTVDGVWFGQTPLFKLDVAPGRHELEVGGKRQSVDVVKGKGLNVWVDLRK
jgi:serine/threonine protein kinase